MHVWNLIFYPKEKVNSEVALLARSSREIFCLKRVPRIADAAEDQTGTKNPYLPRRAILQFLSRHRW